MSEYPWTPGRDRPMSDSHNDMHRYLAETRPQRTARRKLDALAPEMATAILEWAAFDEDFRHSCDAESEAIYAIADKLRHIIKENT